MHFLRTGIVVCCLLLTTCQAIRDEADPNTVSVRGVRPTLEQLNITSTTAAQNAFVYDLVAKAGYVDAAGKPVFITPRSADWAVVTEAGIYEIGRQCNQYLDVLFHFNRNQRALRQGLTAVGAATATILGLASVAAAPIAITAAAFGLSASLFDAGVNSVLFTIEPSALRNIVLKGQKGYLDNLRMDEINTRPRMLIALQGYLAQCSPAAIEANVNNAASGAPSVASTDPEVSQNAAKLAAPAAAALVSERIIQGPVASGTDIRTLTTQELAGNRGPGEQGVRRSQLVKAQEALGLKADGDFGPKTREAILEFQKGANRGRSWPAADINGQLTGRTLIVLSNLSPMPAVFQSPFERGFFGNTGGASPANQYVTPRAAVVNAFLRRFTPPIGDPTHNTDAQLAEKLDMMRARLGQMASSTDKIALTSQLADPILPAASP